VYKVRNIRASLDEVKRRCLAVLRATHPDKRGSGFHDQSLITIVATKVVRDPLARKVYDRIWHVLHKPSHNFRAQVSQLAIDSATESWLIKAVGLDGNELASVSGSWLAFHGMSFRDKNMSVAPLPA
jgi:curved DNA-binding protein CbpA